MKIEDLPNELLDVIYSKIDIISLCKLKIVNKYFNSSIFIDNYCHKTLTFSDSVDNITYNNLNNIVSYIALDIYDEMYLNVISFPESKKYKFNDYELIINRDIIYQLDDFLIISKFKYNCIIRRNDMILPSYIYYSDTLAKKRSSYEPVIIPTLLFYLGIKIINEIDGFEEFIASNFEIPLWLKKILTNLNYPGYLLNDIINGILIL